MEKLQKALRSVWSKEKVLDIEKRLYSFRDEINLQVVANQREQFDTSAVKQSGSHKILEKNTCNIVDLIIEGRDVFNRKTEAQTSDIKAMHVQTNGIIAEQHGETRIEIIEAIQVTEQHSDAEHEATRQQISQMQEAIEELTQQIKQRGAELEETLTEFHKTRSQRKRKSLQERGNAVSVALLALEVMYRNLMFILKSMQERAKRVLEPLSYSHILRASPYSRYHSPSPAATSDQLPSYDSVYDLYYAYFYKDLHARASLVDVDALHKKWLPLQEYTTSNRAPIANSHGFTIQTSSPGAPAI